MECCAVLWHAVAVRVRWSSVKNDVSRGLVVFSKMRWVLLKKGV